MLWLSLRGQWSDSGIHRLDVLFCASDTPKESIERGNMKESLTFKYIQRLYGPVPEDWRRVIQLVKYDADLNVKSVHRFDMNCFVSSLGRLMRDGKVCNLSFGDHMTLTSMFTDTEGNQVRFKRHQIVMQTFYMSERKAGETVDHIHNDRRYDNSIYNLRWAGKVLQCENRNNLVNKSRPVMCIPSGEIFSSCKEVEELFGFARNTVSRVASGERESIHGYRFCYL